MPLPPSTRSEVSKIQLCASLMDDLEPILPRIIYAVNEMEIRVKELEEMCVVSNQQQVLYKDLQHLQRSIETVLFTLKIYI